MACKITGCQQYMPIYLAWTEREMHYREKADTSGVSISPMTLSTNLASRPFVFTLLWHCSFPCVPFVSLLVKPLLRHLHFFIHFLPSALEQCIFDLTDVWTETLYWVYREKSQIHIQNKIKYHKLFPEKYPLCVKRFYFFKTKQKISPHLKNRIYSIWIKILFFLNAKQPT